MALGLSAFSTVDKQNQNGSLNNSEQKQLQGLLLRISQIVSEVAVTREDFEPGEPLLRRLRELKGKRLTAEVLSDLIRVLAGMDMDDVGTLRIEFCNCEPTAGFSIDVSAAPYQGRFRETRIANVTFEVSAGDETGNKGGPLEEFVETVREALNDPIRAPLKVKIVLRRQ